MRLDLQSVTKSFQGVAALDDASLAIADIGCTVFVGPSGGGKSTLMRVVGGLLVPDSGTVKLAGYAVPSGEQDLVAYRRRVGTVFQAYNLFPHMSALRNITLPLVVVHGMSEDEAATRAHEVLARFHLSDHAHKQPAELSGGQRQRVAIARAVSIRPQLLLFDEPTSALDPEMAAEVLDLIEELRDGGAKILLVTHQMAFARRVADHAVFLTSGRVAECSSREKFFGTPQHAELIAFLDKVMRY